MEWAAWEPTYARILQEFGYDRAADEAARDLLDALVADKLRVDHAALRARFAGREVVVAGGAASAADALRIPADAPLLVADAASAAVVPHRRPDALVTDLDGDVGIQVAANALGVPIFVHAHGDNVPALRAHVPELRGPVQATTQAAPTARAMNAGGFTDGDRACCLAVHYGARSLALVGFDWDAPAAKPGAGPAAAATKRAKLAWARRIVDALGVPTRAA